MKTVVRIVALAVLVAAAVTSSLSGTPNDQGYDRERAEHNLLIALSSDNDGLRISAASILADVGSTRAVIPLMRLLREGSEQERIVAAFALSRIGDGRGTWAVKRAVQFDPSENVQKHAAWYYREYAVPKPEESFEVSMDFSLPTPYPEDLTSYDAMAEGR